MIGFAILAFGLLAAAIVPVFVAMRRHHTHAAADQRLRAYRARLAEIEQEARDGVIAAGQAESARHEIEREMLAHVDSGAPATGASPGRSGTAILVTVLVCIAAPGLYLYAGRPDLVGQDLRAVAQPDVAAMVEKINAHLMEHPDDQKGWEMLGRAHMALGRYADAVAAFERLHALAGDTANTLVRLADALAMTAGGSLAGRPGELIARALELEPQHRTALWLAGMAAMERREPAAAVNYWQTLLPLLKDEETKSEVARLIEQAGGMPHPAAAGSPAVKVRIELAPELAARVPLDAVVFVTARAPDGPPMPLAVVRRPASELPFDAVLDDSLAMAPELRLSQHANVDLTARISRAGRAERESGDLFGEMLGIPVSGSEPVILVINATVP